MKILTIGWEPNFIDYLLTPIVKNVEIEFVHGLVGDAKRLSHAQKKFPATKFITLSKAKKEKLCRPDYDLLASLECRGVPTIRSMIQGDRVLRYRSDVESFGYATLLARNVKKAIQEEKPTVILASYDSLHSAISLAVAKVLNVPWVALAFPVIPDNLTGFCYALTPNTLLPLGRKVDEEMLFTAKSLMENVRTQRQSVVAYRAPVSLSQWMGKYTLHWKNLVRRVQEAGILGIDQYLYPTAFERLKDITRRSYNRFRLPTSKMLRTPPDTKYVFYPLHMAPESTVDTWAPFYQDQISFIRQLAQAIPAEFDFIIKLHFSDPDNYSRHQLEQLAKIPRLYLAHPSASGHSFINDAELVVGIQGTSCLEAILLRKPVLIYGDSPYQSFSYCVRAKRPDEVAVQIRDMLNQPIPSDDQIAVEYASYLARYMPGRINDWSKPIDDEALQKYAETFRALQKYIDAPEVRSDWYMHQPFISNAAL